MARYSEHDNSRIYEAVDARNNCLLRDGFLPVRTGQPLATRAVG